MRILIVSQYFWPENFRINDLAEGFVEKGHEVTVLTGIPNYPQGTFFDGYGLFTNRSQEHKGINIRRVPLIPRGNGGSIRLILNYLSFAFIASILAPAVCPEKYDLIFVFESSPVTVGFPAILLKKLKKIPMLFWILDIWPESLSATGAIKSPALLGYIERGVRFIYRHCDRILVSSRGFVQKVEATGGYNGPIEYFPNWIEPQYSVNTPVLPEINVPELPSGFIVMFAGNIGMAQDFPTIIAAADELRTMPDIHWVILGDGRNMGWVQQQIIGRKLEQQVHLLGRYPPETMPSFFTKADVLLLTLRREPIFALTVPGKLQSYMVSGKPIVAGLDGEGAKLITEAQCGYVCPAEDPVQLANNILDIYKLPPDDRKDLGEAGRKYCQKYFDRANQLDKLENIMLDVLNQ